jgi:hypothetical protein
MLPITSEQAAELLVVLFAVSDYLRTIDEPLPAFALRGVAEALTPAITQKQPDDD